MKIKQLADVLNGTLSTTGIIDQVTGEAAVANEDLSDIVDIGKAVIDYTGASNANFDSFMRNLIDQVGRIMFVNRTYTSQAPNILKDGWEYGSILQKVRCEVPEARDNATWDLFNYPQNGGDAYPDPFELSKPSAQAKFFNSKATYEVPITLTDVQLREAFQTAAQFGSFIAMIENRIAMKITLCNDGLIMATIANLIAQKVAAGKAVNLLTLYKTVNPSATTTAATALADKEFLRFASKTIAQYKKYLATASTLYNDGSYITFTPADRLKFIANTEFSKSLDAYLYSDTYHNEFVNLPGYEEVAFWQGTGTGNADRLKINVKIDDGTAQGATVVQDGIVAVMFDDEAAAVCNQNYRVTSQYNGRGEYTNYFYKWDAMYMNDIQENCVVFVIADETAEEGAPSNFNVAGKTGSLWNVTIGDYQSGITVTGNAITGTLTKDTATDAWTTKWGTGYYIALQFSGSAATTDVSVGLVPSAGSGMVRLDSDKDALFYLGDYASGTTLNKKLAVRVGGKYYEYTLSGLTLS